MIGNGIDPVLDAVVALRAVGVVVLPIGDALARWPIGCFTFSDAALLRLAESRGLVQAS